MAPREPLPRGSDWWKPSAGWRYQSFSMHESEGEADRARVKLAAGLYRGRRSRCRYRAGPARAVRDRAARDVRGGLLAL
ncbi:hypothetical protein GCM10010234_42010 [Streptomyces hawaiiensis]